MRVKAAIKGFHWQGMEEEVLWVEVDALKGPLVAPNPTEFDRGYQITRRICSVLEDVRGTTVSILANPLPLAAGMLSAALLSVQGTLLWVVGFPRAADTSFLMLYGFYLVLGCLLASFRVLVEHALEQARPHMANLDSLSLRDFTSSRGVGRELTEDISRLAQSPRTLQAGKAFLGRWRSLLLEQGQPIVLRRALAAGEDRAVLEAVGVGPLNQDCWPYGPAHRLAGVLTRAIAAGRLEDARLLVRAGVLATLPDDAGTTAAMAVRRRLPAAVAKRDYRLTYRLLAVAPVAWPDRRLCDSLVDLVGGTYPTPFWVKARPLIRQAVDDAGGAVASYAFPDGVRRALAELQAAQAPYARLHNWIEAWSPESVPGRQMGQSFLLQLIRENRCEDARRVVLLGAIEPTVQTEHEAQHLCWTLRRSNALPWA